MREKGEIHAKNFQQWNMMWYSIYWKLMNKNNNKGQRRQKKEENQ